MYSIIATLLQPKQKGPAVILQVLDFRSGWRDLNSRPLAPQTNTLTMLSYIPNGCKGKSFLVFFKPDFCGTVFGMG